MIILSVVIFILLVVIYYMYRQNSRLQDSLRELVEGEDEVENGKIAALQYGFEVPNNKGVTKSEAMEIVNSFLGKHKALNNSNTNFSSINKTVGVWWFDINTTRFLDDLHLILAKKRGFVWLKIPKGTVEDPGRIFYIRPDNGLVQLKISPESGSDYLRDVSSGTGDFKFSRYVEKEF